LKWDGHTYKECGLIYIMIFVARFCQPRIPTFKSTTVRKTTYLKIPIPPGDNSIGNGLSRGYFNHRLAKARKIRPCATYDQE
jgi:hypothetical protein